MTRFTHFFAKANPGRTNSAFADENACSGLMGMAFKRGEQSPTDFRA